MNRLYKCQHCLKTFSDQRRLTQHHNATRCGALETAALAAIGNEAAVAVAEQAQAARVAQEQHLQAQEASASVQYHQDESPTDAMQVGTVLSYQHCTSRSDVFIH
jgi:hypothetical protein